MDLLIHVGLHKTGTTTVQELLYSVSSELKTQGILYPDSGMISCQHSLIPGCLVKTHPFLDPSQRSRDPETYLKALKHELDQFSPALTVISSEVFTEVRRDKEACLQLIASLSSLFNRTSLLLTLREENSMALSSIKHLQRVNFMKAPVKYNSAFTNPIAVYSGLVSNAESAVSFWRESGLTVHERSIEKATSSLADYYFGDIFDTYNPKARELLRPETNKKIESNLQANSDELPQLAYLILFLFGNSIDSDSFLEKPVLDIILEQINLAGSPAHSLPIIKSSHLLAYLDYCVSARSSATNREVPDAQKAKALKHARFSSDEIQALFSLRRKVKLQLINC